MKINYQFKPYLYLTIATFSLKLCFFAANIVFAKILASSEFGMFSLFRSIVQTADGVFINSVGNITVKEISNSNGSDGRNIEVSDDITGSFITLFIWLIVTTIGFMTYISFYGFDITNSNDLTILMFSALAVSLTLSSLSTSVTTAIKKYEYLVLSSFLSFITFLCCLPIFLLYPSVETAILVFTAIVLVDSAWKLFKLITEGFLYYNVDIRKVFKLARQASPLMASAIIHLGSLMLGRILLANTESGFVHLATFELGLQITMIGTLLVNVIVNVLAPKLTSKNNNSKSDAFGALTKSTLISIVLISLFVLTSHEIEVFYEGKYTDLSRVILVLSFSTLIFCFSSVLQRWVIAYADTRILLASTTLSSPLYLPLVHLYGTTAIALAVIVIIVQCANLVLTASLFFYLEKE